MSQQIVQVAGDSLALGDLGEVLDLIVRHTQLFGGTVAERSVMVAESNQDDQQQHRAPKRYGQIESIDVHAKHGHVEAEQHEHSAKIGMEAPRSRCVNQKSDSALVDRDEDC